MNRRLLHEDRIFILVLLAGAPALAAAMLLLWPSDLPVRVKIAVTVIVGPCLLGAALAVRARTIRPLQTLSNLAAALAEGDFSIRARHARSDEALGLAFWEMNQLTDVLREQRLGAVEANALLGTVMTQIDAAVLTFDEMNRLRLLNAAGARLLGAAPRELIGRDAPSLGLADTLVGDTPRIRNGSSLGRAGERWELRRCSFRQEGRPHQLVLLTDLSRTLREEERQAWKRLIRVLSHEINNSLAPIRSMSASLREQLAHERRSVEWESDVQRGLEVIGGRAEALIRFMQAYARLARLPPPRCSPVEVADWVHRVAQLETRLPVEISGGPLVQMQADGDQLDQVLINLLANAVEAALETGGGVRVGWSQYSDQVEVWIEDDGPGLADSGNLFVPFFTTKPGGTGIGLVLSRQIAEAHGGSITVEDKPAARGCVARIQLPLGGRD